MTELSVHEFRSLRDAVAARGHLRSALALAGLGLWAFALLVTLAVLPFPVAAALPLTVLWGAFEIVRPLHAGAERIGRYLQVFYEEAPSASAAPTPAWERTAMALGPSLPGAAGHPLFVPVFAVAVLVNLLAVVLPGPVPVELGLMSVPHAACLVWLVRCDRAMRAQRAHELDRFRRLRDRQLA